MDIASSDIAVKVVRPDRKNPSPRSALPEPLVVTAHAHTSWNNSTLYEEVYRRGMLQPYQSSALQTRVLNRELIVGSPAGPPQPCIASARPSLELLLIHDFFSGHLTPWNVYAFMKDHVGTAVVPASCTAFALWLGVFHQVLRPLIEMEISRRISLGAKLAPYTNKEWRQLFTYSMAAVLFRPEVARPMEVIAAAKSRGCCKVGWFSGRYAFM